MYQSRWYYHKRRLDPVWLDGSLVSSPSLSLLQELSNNLYHLRLLLHASARADVL
jgi:hypothetical protein